MMQTTMVELESTKFEWQIANFDRLMKFLLNGEEVVSQRFSTSTAPDVLWELHIYPNGKRKEDSDCVSLFLHQAGMKMRKKPIMTEFSIFFSAPNSWFSKPLRVCNGVKTFVYEESHGNFNIPHKDILNFLNFDVNLQINCNIDYLLPNCHLDAADVEGSVEERLLVAELCFKNILDTGFLSDFVIEVEDEVIQCHRCILASNSAVFRSMFEQSTMIESRSGILRLSDCSATAVKGLLEFMYTGRVEKLDVCFEELLAFSEKYDMPKLKRICEHQFIPKLNSRNVCNVLIFADTYYAESLKRVCLNFLRENHKNVLATEEWKILKNSNPRLSGDLLEWFVNDCKGLTICQTASIARNGERK